MRRHFALNEHILVNTFLKALFFKVRSVSAASRRLVRRVRSGPAPKIVFGDDGRDVNSGLSNC